MYNKYGEKLESAFHNTEREDVIVIIAHGLTGSMDREMCSFLAKGLAERGWPALRFSFSGHGNSEGSFDEMTISKEIEDLQSVIDQYKGARKLAYIGHSMGAAVGALTAVKDDRINVLISLAGMVFTRQFYDQEFSAQVAGESVMWENKECPLSQAFKEDLYTIDSILPLAKDIRLPWLIAHGADDDVVFPNHGEQLYASLKGKKKHVVYDGEEHHFEGVLPKLLDEIDQWLHFALK